MVGFPCRDGTILIVKGTVASVIAIKRLEEEIDPRQKQVVPRGIPLVLYERDAFFITYLGA